jgi:hypothetical protein
MIRICCTEKRDLKSSSIRLIFATLPDSEEFLSDGCNFMTRDWASLAVTGVVRNWIAAGEKIGNNITADSRKSSLFADVIVFMAHLKKSGDNAYFEICLSLLKFNKKRGNINA